jgi:hypothetical protein
MKIDGGAGAGSAFYWQQQQPARRAWHAEKAERRMDGETIKPNAPKGS